MVELSHHNRKMKEEVVRRIELPNEVLLAQVREVIREGHTATINVKGYSMRPFLEHCRDKVCLSPVGTLAVGDAVLAEIAPGKYVLHRIITLNGDYVTLMGDGNLRGVEHCRREDVVGVVELYYHFGREIAAGNPALKRRIRLWRKCLPIRRCLLFVYKVNLRLKDILG